MVFFSAALEFDWLYKSNQQTDEDAAPSFEKLDMYFSDKADDQTTPYSDIEKAIEKIKDTLNHPAATEDRLIAALPGKMVHYLEYAKEKPEKKLQLMEIAKIFGRTHFLEAIVEKLMLSLTPSPAPPTAAERTTIVAWIRFCETFSTQIPAPIVDSLKGVKRVLTLYKKEEIDADPYLETVADLASRFHNPSPRTPLSAKHQEQLKFIEEFSAWFLKCYLLEPLCEETLSIQSIAQITECFKNHFSQMSAGLFLHDPRPIVASEKKLIINLTQGTNRFLSKIRTALKKITVINSPEFTQMFYALTHEGLYDREKILIDIHTKLNQSLDILLLPKADFQPPADKILVLLLTTALLNLIKCLVDPSVTPFIIEQLFARTVPHFDDTPPQHNRDNQFALSLGNELTELCKHLLQLGEGNTLIQVVLSGLKILLGSNKQKMGAFMHEKFNSFTSRELILEPFRFLSTFLFAKDGEMNVPIFRHHLDQTPSQKQEYCAKTKQSFLEHLHPTILKWVQKLNTSGAKMMDNEATRIYCNSLGEKLWEISQNSDLMLMLIDEILTGIHKSVKE